MIELDLSKIPTRITRADYLQAIRNLGVDTDNVKSLEFKPDGIYLTVFAARRDGCRCIDRHDGIPQHRLYIPVDDGDPTDLSRNVHAAAVRDKHVTADVLRDDEPALVAAANDHAAETPSLNMRAPIPTSRHLHVNAASGGRLLSADAGPGYHYRTSPVVVSEEGAA